MWQQELRRNLKGRPSFTSQSDSYYIFCLFQKRLVVHVTLHESAWVVSLSSTKKVWTRTRLMRKGPDRAAWFEHLLRAYPWNSAWEVLLRGAIEEIRAGDGTRTRDSLLGRQGVMKSTLVCYKVAWMARLYDILQCERPWQKMSRAFFGAFGKRCHAQI